MGPRTHALKRSTRKQKRLKEAVLLPHSTMASIRRCQRGSMERKTSKPIFATRTIAMQEIWFYPSWHSFCPQLFWLEISNFSIFRIKLLVEYLSLQVNRVIWKYAILSEQTIHPRSS